MIKGKVPSSPAIRALREHGVDFIEHTYRFQKRSAASIAAQELGLDDHVVIKTLVMEDDQGQPFIILMHGDKQASTKALARAVGAKSVDTCNPVDAQRHTGYMVGGISPFGTKKQLPVYIEESILNFHKIFINAGRRGLLVEIAPADLVKVLKPIPVNVAR